MTRLLLRTTRADHPLLAQVAEQARRTTHAAAAAITRAGHDDHELIAFAGDAAALDAITTHTAADFRPGEHVVVEGAVATGLLPLSAEALRAADAERDLALTLDASVQALAQLLDLRDGYTGQHSSTVVALCMDVGRRVGVAGAELDHLRIEAHLHDLGKIGVPDQILHKPGALDPAEWSIMREHPVWGARALEQIPGFRAAARAVRHHHERWDGTGYPDGLAGEAIPIGARVIAVCDAYEAMTSTPPYRPALAEPLAIERIVAGTGSHFDPAATWGLLGALAEQPGPRVP
jgi:HD-GYP domain-containing protein (c-di-GMP phosphodiesterase class II)